jgi:hypothetical protein
MSGTPVGGRSLYSCSLDKYQYLHRRAKAWDIIRDGSANEALCRCIGNECLVRATRGWKIR